MHLLEHPRRWLESLLAAAAPAQREPPVMARAREIALVLALVGLALALRTLGGRLGLPYFHHWDETLITSSARSMLEHHDDIPTNFFYGAPMMRLTALCFPLVRALGLVTTPDEITLRWIARGIGILLASSGTAAIYVATRSAMLDRRAAVISALLYASAQELVWHARFAVTDASVVALTAWTLAFSALFLRTGSLWVALAAIVASSLTFSFKLTGLATLIMPVGALLLRTSRSPRPTQEDRDSASSEARPPIPPTQLDLPVPEHGPGTPSLPRLFAVERGMGGEVSRRSAALGSTGTGGEVLHRLLLASAVPLAFGIFLALNPHVRTDWRRAFGDFEGIARHYREGHVKPFCEREPGLEHLAAAFAFVLTESTHTSRVVATCIGGLALAGLVIAAKKPVPIVWLGVMHAVGVVFSMAWPNRAYLVRQYLTALPILCVGFGIGALVVWDRLGARGWARARLALPIAWLVAAGVTVYQSLDAQVLSDDARVRAIDHVARIVSGETRGESRGETQGEAQGEKGQARAPVLIAFSPAVAGALALGGHGELRPRLERPGLKILPDVATAEAATRSKARFVIVASHRDLQKIWPYEEQWSFTSVAGFHEIARFAFSPYEHRLDLVPTWDGHVTAIVLERDNVIP